MEKKLIGMYGGSFNPLHKGHIKCINEALSKVDELHLIVGNLPNRDDFNYEEKISWFRDVFKNNTKIHYHCITDPSKEKQEYTLDMWKADAAKIKDMVGKHIDIVFCGADYNREDNPYKVCYVDSDIMFLSRNDDNISSTRFKSDIDKYKDDVPTCVYESYKKRQNKGK